MCTRLAHIQYYLCDMKTSHKQIITDSGQLVEASSPIIISASRATDIPAFYADWFFNRLEHGYIRWRNPYNGKDSYVSFEDTRFIVFWSKNPQPLLEYLPRLKDKGIGCYIQFTLNDYERDGLEPNVPVLKDRIDTFKRLVDALGVGAVVWRFDPLLLTDKIGIENLLEKISHIANELKGNTEKLVFSFADIEGYRKVGRNLATSGVNYREWTEEEMLSFAKQLSELNLGLELATCAERLHLEEFGIAHNRCIDPGLICRLQPTLQPYLWNTKRDKGQRPLCGCIASKDIGAYNTCPHGCLYCYANSSPAVADSNHQLITAHPFSDTLTHSL